MRKSRSFLLASLALWILPAASFACGPSFGGGASGAEWAFLLLLLALVSPFLLFHQAFGPFGWVALAGMLLFLLYAPGSRSSEAPGRAGRALVAKPLAVDSGGLESEGYRLRDSVGTAVKVATTFGFTALLLLTNLR